MEEEEEEEELLQGSNPSNKRGLSAAVTEASGNVSAPPFLHPRRLKLEITLLKKKSEEQRSRPRGVRAHLPLLAVPRASPVRGPGAGPAAGPLALGAGRDGGVLHLRLALQPGESGQRQIYRRRIRIGFSLLFTVTRFSRLVTFDIIRLFEANEQQTGVSPVRLTPRSPPLSPKPT